MLVTKDSNTGKINSYDIPVDYNTININQYGQLQANVGSKDTATVIRYPEPNQSITSSELNYLNSNRSK